MSVDCGIKHTSTASRSSPSPFPWLPLSRTHVLQLRGLTHNGNAFQLLPHLISCIARCFFTEWGALFTKKNNTVLCRSLSQHSHLLEGHISPFFFLFTGIVAYYFFPLCHFRLFSRFQILVKRVLRRLNAILSVLCSLLLVGYF